MPTSPRKQPECMRAGTFWAALDLIGGGQKGPDRGRLTLSLQSDNRISTSGVRFSHASWSHSSVLLSPCPFLSTASVSTCVTASFSPFTEPTTGFQHWQHGQSATECIYVCLQSAGKAASRSPEASPEHSCSHSCCTLSLSSPSLFVSPNRKRENAPRQLLPKTPPSSPSPALPSLRTASASPRRIEPPWPCSSNSRSTALQTSLSRSPNTRRCRHTSSSSPPTALCVMDFVSGCAATAGRRASPRSRLLNQSVRLQPVVLVGPRREGTHLFTPVRKQICTEQAQRQPQSRPLPPLLLLLPHLLPFPKCVG